MIASVVSLFLAAILTSQSYTCSASPTAATLPTSVQTLQQNASVNARELGIKPIYAIAHRVLTVQGARDALSHGANALEIDMTAWSKGWWADHDGLPTSAGDTAETMFKTLAEERLKGRPVTFVWLDLKNPDYCDASQEKWRHCSIDALRRAAQAILEPVGIRVLYGFSGKDIGGKAYHFIRQSLSSSEGFNVNGRAAFAEKELGSAGIAVSQRVMSYGYFNLPFQFETTLGELKEAKQSGAFGKVFGWTLANHNNKSYASRLLGEAQVDGLIYGFKAAAYYDHVDTRSAFNDIHAWVKGNAGQYRLATIDDIPW